MGNKNTKKNREHKKILFTFHRAFAEVMNSFTDEDYKAMRFYTRTAGSFSENLLSDYEKYLKLCIAITKRKRDGLGIFDKAICYGMSIKKNAPVLVSGITEETPEKFRNLCDKLIAKAMIEFISCSSYRLEDGVTEVISEKDFSLECFFAQHKDELDMLEKELLSGIIRGQLDYNTCFLALTKIYSKAVIYQEGLLDIDEALLMKKINLSEKMEVSSETVVLNDAYLRNVKRNRNLCKKKH